MTFTIEPMLTLGTTTGDVGRRVDGRDEGPQAHGPVRAHDRRHRPRAEILTLETQHDHRTPTSASTSAAAASRARSVDLENTGRLQPRSGPADRHPRREHPEACATSSPRSSTTSTRSADTADRRDDPRGRPARCRRRRRTSTRPDRRLREREGLEEAPARRLRLNDADAAGYGELTRRGRRATRGLVILTTLGTGIGRRSSTARLVPNGQARAPRVDDEDAEMDEASVGVRPGQA